MGKINFCCVWKGIIITAFLPGCVSVRLGSHKLIHSSDVELNAPAPPFEAKSSTQEDRLWLNPINGNAISFLSDCHNPVDPSLKNLQSGVLSQIDEVTILESRQLTYNERAALHTLAEGSVDGVRSRMEFLLFKKNHCLYVLSYLGVAERFGDDQRRFQKFIKEFKVR